jgi:hypothetical protein
LKGFVQTLEGEVNGKRKRVRRPHVFILLRGRDGLVYQLDAVVDTGFTGAISIPRVYVGSMGLVLEPATLEDQNSYRVGGGGDPQGGNVTYEAEFLGPDNRWQRCLVDTVDPDEVLVGMDFFEGNSLTVHAKLAGTLHLYPPGSLLAFLLKFYDDPPGLTRYGQGITPRKFPRS